MSRWFRHYAGMMRDEKIVRAAMKARQSVERVVWVWGAILESAAEKQGGHYDLDPEEAAYFLRCDGSEISDILAALESLGRISQGVVVRWGDRQFESDASKERQQRYRERRRGADVAVPQGDDHNSDSDGVKPSRDAEVTVQENIDIDRVEKNNLTVVPKEIAEAFAAYNDMAERVGLSRATKLSPQRQSKLKARLRDAGGIAGWCAALGRVAASAYCRGEVNGFKADLGFLLQDESFTRLMEGKYDDRKHLANNSGHHKPNTISDGFAQLGAIIDGQIAEIESGQGMRREDTQALPRIRQSTG